MNQVYPEITITLTAVPTNTAAVAVNDEDDYARWQTEDSPCFPRPLCVALPPKRPARQTTEGAAQCSSSSVEDDYGDVVGKESSCLTTSTTAAAGPQSGTADATAPRRPRRRVTLEKGSLQRPAALAAAMRQATPPPPQQQPRCPIRQHTGNFNRSSVSSSTDAFLFSSHDNAIEEISNDSSTSTSSETEFGIDDDDEDDDDEQSVDQAEIMTMSLSHRFDESCCAMALSHRFDESMRLDDVMGESSTTTTRMDCSLRDLSPCRPTRQRTSTRTTAAAAAAAAMGGDMTVSSTATSTASSTTTTTTTTTTSGSYGGVSRRVSSGITPTSPFANADAAISEQPEWVKLWESQGAGGGGGNASLVWDF